MAGRPKKLPGAPKAKYTPRIRTGAAKEAEVRALERQVPVEMKTIRQAMPAAVCFLSAVEEEALLALRDGKSSAWIERYLNYPAKDVVPLSKTHRALAFLEELTRQYSILRASKAAEAGLRALNYLDEVVSQEPDFASDEKFSELDVEKRVGMTIAHSTMRVRAAAEITRANTKEAASGVSINFSGSAGSSVALELIRRLRGEPVGAGDGGEGGEVVGGEVVDVEAVEGGGG